jgi:hypothetical protein
LVSDEGWNKAVEKKTPRQCESEEINDLLQSYDFPTDLTMFIELCSKSDLQI